MYHLILYYTITLTTNNDNSRSSWDILTFRCYKTFSFDVVVDNDCRDRQYYSMNSFIFILWYTRLSMFRKCMMHTLINICLQKINYYLWYIIIVYTRILCKFFTVFFIIIPYIMEFESHTTYELFRSSSKIFFYYNF